MKSSFSALLIAACVAVSAPVAAHHSFAVFDMEKDVPYEGVVKTLKFRNPHMSMTLEVTKEDGSTEIIDFVEGAPANMLARMGVNADMLKPGTRLTAVGAPRHDNPKALFLKEVIFEDGSHYNVLRSN